MTSQDPNWTPKEPKRPLQPKLGAFGVSKSFSLPDLEKAVDETKVEKLMEEVDENSKADDGSAE